MQYSRCKGGKTVPNEKKKAGPTALIQGSPVIFSARPLLPVKRQVLELVPPRGVAPGLGVVLGLVGGLGVVP